MNGSMTCVTRFGRWPTISATGTVTFVAGGLASVLDSSVGITDPDSSGNLIGATVAVSDCESEPGHPQTNALISASPPMRRANCRMRDCSRSLLSGARSVGKVKIT